MEPDPQSAVDRWLAPISEGSPAGEDQRYESAHEALKAQISGVGAVAIDWQIYSTEAEKLLVTGGKDLLIACYLAYASFQTEGIAGLAKGLALVSGMLERYWETCFPAVEKVRGRVNAIVWLVDRVASELGETPATDDSQAAAALQRETSHLQRAVAARFDAGAIDLAPFAAAVEKIATSAGRAPEETPRAPIEANDGKPVEPHAPATDPRAARLDELKKGFAEPIPGDSPAGEDSRYDDEYEAVRSEVDKLGRAEADQVDWELIFENSRTLLIERSKDLRVSCYFAGAAFQQAGIPGLIEGLAAVTAIVESYWDDGFPTVRARPGAMKWLVERLESLRDVHPEPEQEEDIETLELAIQGLTTVVQEKFPAPAPSFRKLVEAVDQLRRSLRAEEPPPTPPQPPPPEPRGNDHETNQSEPSTRTDTRADKPPTPAGGGPKLDAPPPPPTDPSQVTDFLRTTGSALHQASRQLFKASPKDPLAYRLARLSLYLHINEAPGTTNGNSTMVPPPAPDRVQQLQALMAAKNWVALLDEAESLLPRARLWIDLQRYVAVALAGLGHEEARDVVLAEIGSLIKRMPELMERAFNDGQPFADKQTQDWLRAEVLETASAGGPSLGGSGSPTAIDEQLAEAHKLALGGKLEAALGKLSSVADSEAVVGRDRFRAKLAMAEACVAAGSRALAEGIYAGLNAEIGRFQLEEWEPNLAEACYRGRYEALMAMAADGTKPPQELAEVYRQLCRVAPATALKLGKPKT